MLVPGTDVTVIFETVHGSRAYGLATESSDTDLRGVLVPAAVTDTVDFDADLARLEALLETARSESPLPPESPNNAALDQFLVEQRKGRFK